MILWTEPEIAVSFYFNEAVDGQVVMLSFSACLHKPLTLLPPQLQQNEMGIVRTDVDTHDIVRIRTSFLISIVIFVYVNGIKAKLILS